MQDVVKNATTELISGRKIELVMNLKGLLHSCTAGYIDILLFYYESEHTKIKIRKRKEIRKRKDFCDFIETYGDSVVNGWAIESENGIPCIIFDLENLVMKGIPTVKPTTKDELKEIIKHTIEEQGFECDLNFIDTSNITDMSWLFDHSRFNGDISKWDVSNVRDMKEMFCFSRFNGDIADWNVSKVEDMSWMFYYSEFNGDISSWDVSNVKNMRCMFYESDFDGDISKWDVSNVEDMRSMFGYCPLGDNPPEWY